MTNYDTVRAITENIQAALQKEGVRFSRMACDEPKSVPASLLPLGRIFYAGESFENAHGERPLYIEAEFALDVLVAGRDPEDLMREEQGWVHKIRGALTVSSLNAGSLSQSKSVSRVTLKKINAVNRKGASSIECALSVRYREI